MKRGTCCSRFEGLLALMFVVVVRSSGLDNLRVLAADCFFLDVATGAGAESTEIVEEEGSAAAFFGRPLATDADPLGAAFFLTPSATDAGTESDLDPLAV